jgi:presequence protease
MFEEATALMHSFNGFELLREQALPELDSAARFYSHAQTGAELLSIVNDDDNKVFGVTFRTPPRDSTGVAHSLSTPCFAARASTR